MSHLPVPIVLKVLTLAALMGLQSQSAAYAEPGSNATGIYVCKDADGRVISSDQPIKACAERPMRELNRDGSVRRVVPPPLTRQQEKEAARQALVRQQKERELRAQQAHDRHLLLTYQSPEDLRQRQRVAVQMIDDEIDAAVRRILTLDQTLQAERKAAQEWRDKQSDKNARLPFTMQQRISSIANAILAEDAMIKERRTERERLNKDFDANAARLTELLAHIANTPESSNF